MQEGSPYALDREEGLVDKALRDIAEFENGHTQGMFYRLPRVSVAKGLRERVQKPSTLDQNQANCCGPAASFIAS